MGARTFVRAIAVALVAAVALYFWNHRSGQLLNLLMMRGCNMHAMLKTSGWLKALTEVLKGPGENIL